MFTGLIEARGEVLRLDHEPGQPDARLEILAPRVTDDAAPGDSIAVNGVCLTVVTVTDGGFTADVLPETLRRTSLGELAPGSPVNLERALAASARLGGHIVQGHVDGVATLASRTAGERWDDLVFEAPRELLRYVAEKGSVAVDGISLTVTGVTARGFGVSIIPTTSRETTLGALEVGARVNLEVDVLAKYVERMLQWREEEAR
ncbi:riboflavin synthase [Gulosibacter faecalis]|uniref:Riboflavin synthase n=1 Tax=Gulosibacter faecalis TaxID=272240 RepID=A0ABW5UW80_9MICO|nr:riboflavin synthase [Gulosibacter faecalis]